MVYPTTPGTLCQPSATHAPVDHTAAPSIRTSPPRESPRIQHAGCHGTDWSSGGLHHACHLAPLAGDHGLRVPVGAGRAHVRARQPARSRPLPRVGDFEFIADDGSINEVDLLVLTPKGFYLVEIKSRPGIVEGDQGTWTWRGGGRVQTVDNPLLLANRKAKKLISLLRRQPALQRKTSSPFLEAHVFLSHEDVDCRVAQDLRDRVHLRDTGAGRDERPGIVAALTRHSIGTPVRTQPDRPMAKAVSRAMQEAGIRPSQRARRVGDYRLDELLLEGPNYQDWTAHHAAIDGERARVRIYAIAQSASDDERSGLQRAARREYQILRDVRHEGILAAKGCTEHVLGPALVFEHRDGSQRFDHWLTERAAKLDVDTRLHLLRQLADALRYAHAKHLVHRALSPQSILVVDPEAAQPRVRILLERIADAGDLILIAGQLLSALVDRTRQLIEPFELLPDVPTLIVRHDPPRLVRGQRLPRCSSG